MNNTRVYLIGGAPGAGKTTLGCALAARIGGSSVTIDDIMTVAKTATTPQSHPDLYLHQGISFQQYFTDSSVEQLQRDAERQSAAVWPFVKALIEKHFHWTTTPIVIDGWHLRPRVIAQWNADRVHASWIYVDPAVLEARERKNADFLVGSTNPELMFQNFLARSLWANESFKQDAEACGFPVLEQFGTNSVDELCDQMRSC